MKKFFLLFLMILELSGCYFHPRSPTEFPVALKTMYFSPEKKYSTLSIQLRALFHSMNADLVASTNEAPFTVKISNDVFSYIRATVVDATLPSTMTYTQTATVSVIDNKTNKPLTSQTFTTTQAITLNANQVYTAGANDLVRQQLNHELVSLIYYWLISTNTKNAINHANQPRATR